MAAIELESGFGDRHAPVSAIVIRRFRRSGLSESADVDMAARTVTWTVVVDDESGALARRLSWADLLRRVFADDVLQSPRWTLGRSEQS